MALYQKPKKKSITFFNQLVALLGPTLAIEFIRTYGGQQIYVPSVKTISNKKRDQDIRIKHFQQGISMHELSIEYGLSHVRISQILRGK